MKLYDISEPGESNSLTHNAIYNDEVAVGIDLGTTNSLVAVSFDSKPNIICDDEGGILPSAVSDGNQEIASFKRLMGKSVDEIGFFKNFYDIQSIYGNNPAINLNGKLYTPVELSSIILKKLKFKAEKFLNKKISKAVVTVPAYFDDAARLATKDAANIAGLDVLRLINEPTAAAIAYGLDKEVSGNYLVFDLGGGTFDISLLKIEDKVFHVVATGGDSMLGGDDYDIIISKYLVDNYPSASSIDKIELKKISRKIKEKLTKKDFCEINDFGLKFDDFEKVTAPLTNKAIQITHKLMIEAGYSEEEIQGVIFVGGSTRMRVIRNAFERTFKIKILDDINPDEVVALGAAIQAESLIKGSEHLLLDVNPMSIGVEIMGGLVEKIIPRNTTIPASFTKTYTTYQDGQTAMSFHIVQGERELAEDNRSLAKFVLNNIPPMKAGIPRINIKFLIDADSILTVTAWEEISNSRQTIEIRPSYGLANEVIREMIFEAIDNAEADFIKRQIAEKKADIIILKTQIESVIKDIPDIEVPDLNKTIEITNNLDNCKDIDKLEKIFTELEKISELVAEKHLENGLAKKLKGLKIEDLENSIYTKGD